MGGVYLDTTLQIKTGWLVSPDSDSSNACGDGCL